MYVTHLLCRYFLVVHRGLVRPSFPKVIDAVLLAAAVLLKFLRCGCHQSELDLLCCELEENLFGTFVHPIILPAPHQVDVIGMMTNPYTQIRLSFIMNFRLYQYILALVWQQESGC